MDWSIDDLDDNDDTDDDETAKQQWWTHHLAEALYTEISVVRRSPDYVRENGMCLDNIVTRDSSLEGAGMGAFAQRPLQKGQPIVPVPLLHLSNRSHFSRLTTSPSSDSSTNLFDELIVNYCYAHDETTMQLCPLTNSMLINHCSNRFPERCSRNVEIGPNAKLQWAEATTKSLTESVEQIGQSTHERKMSLSILATQNIELGEEIFIDYGQSWEMAWEYHVRQWMDDSPWTTQEVMNQLDDIPTHYGDLRGDSSNITPDGRFLTICWNPYGNTLARAVLIFMK
jgi:hypothetical protein